MKKLWTKINGAYLPILFALFLIIGVLVGYLIQKEENAKPRYLVYPDNEKISEVINYIVSHYVDSVDKESLVYTAIMAMLDSLDPHSVYIPAEDLNEVNETLEGEFSGIG